MKRAVSYVAKANGLAGKSEQKALAPAAPAVPKAPATVKSKLDAAASQPPIQGGVSGGEVEPDYANLTDEEWAALPASTLARLRGDTF